MLISRFNIYLIINGKKISDHKILHLILLNLQKQYFQSGRYIKRFK